MVRLTNILMQDVCVIETLNHGFILYLPACALLAVTVAASLHIVSNRIVDGYMPFSHRNADTVQAISAAPVWLIAYKYVLF